MLELNRIYNEDCLEGMKKIEDKSIDCIITDPPYGISFKSNYRKVKYNDIYNDDCLDWLENFIQLCYDKLKDNTHFYCFCSWHNIDKFKIIIQKKFKIKNILIWKKNNTGMGDLKGQYASKYEMCIFAQRGRKEIIGRRDADIIEFKKTNNKLHPTQKPLELIEFLIKHSSNENDLILDPFMGSGTTAIACMNNNRNFIGFELNKEYYDIINKRIEDNQKQIKLL